MPIYEYTCRSCGANFETLLPASRRDDVSEGCPQCGAQRIVRKISLMAQPVVREGAAVSGGDYSCGAPSCCGGRCAVD